MICVFMICIAAIHLTIYRNGDYACFTTTVYHFRDVIFIRTVTQ